MYSHGSLTIKPFLFSMVFDTAWLIKNIIIVNFWPSLIVCGGLKIKPLLSSVGYYHVHRLWNSFIREHRFMIKGELTPIVSPIYSTQKQKEKEEKTNRNTNK